MSHIELMRELFINLEDLSNADIIIEYGIEYLKFKLDAQKIITKIRLARIYIPIGDNYIGVN